MVITLWILKALIAIIFVYVGVHKLLYPKAKLLDKGMKGLTPLTEKQIKIAGVLELLGVIGLILPSAINFYPILSAYSALGLGLTMIVAGIINFKLKLSIVPNILALTICIFIAYQAFR